MVLLSFMIFLYEIAKHRDHPQQDAIHVAGWVSLFTLHILWPFLWIWATLYRKDRGWGFGGMAKESEDIQKLKDEISDLTKRLDALEHEPEKKNDVEGAE
jgi:hypothetical protein